MSNTIRLEGCRPEPLAHYLKALAVLRLVAEQADNEAAGFWEGDTFCLNTRLTEQELIEFFLKDYTPTPIIAPWNGGSGFYYQEEKLKDKDPITGKRKKTGRRNQPTEATKTVERLINSKSERLANYRKVLYAAKQTIQYMGLDEAPKDEGKYRLLASLRESLPEEALAWFDAAVLLGTEKPGFPPLLGTGGNDGNLDFSNNFMQRIADILNVDTGVPQPEAAKCLKTALFSATVPGLQRDSAVGQFYPRAAGGANGTAGFDAKSLLNPWDFLLMIEGSLAFVAATTKKLGNSHDGALSYPFTFRASGVDYASAVKNDEDPRGEIWMPLWEKPAGISEIMALFAEGRATVNRRQAVNGVDFARAVAMLGTDRGITAFNRFGFQKRNGKAYFANPLGRWKVNYIPETNLISEIDGWLDSFRRAASGDNAPASMGRALRDVESAIMELCRNGAKRNVQALCISLGKAEQALARSSAFRKKAFVKPIPLLSADWLTACDDNSLEFRLAGALASAAIRENMEPVRVNRWVGWDENDKPPRVVWGEGHLTEKLISVLERRIIDSNSDDKFQAFTAYSNRPAMLYDIAAFIRGEVDETRLEDLLWGLNLIDWRSIEYKNIPREEGRPIPLSYAILKLCFLPGPLDDIKIPVQPAIIARAKAGDASAATRLSSHRLTASGFVPRVKVISEDRQILRRCAAALLFPINREDIQLLAGMVLQPTKKSQQKGGE
jgi:CRISPR-associated protein Csx17